MAAPTLKSILHDGQRCKIMEVQTYDDDAPANLDVAFDHPAGFPKPWQGNTAGKEIAIALVASAADTDIVLAVVQISAGNVRVRKVTPAGVFGHDLKTWRITLRNPREIAG